MICRLCGFEFEPTGMQCHAKCPMSRHCNLICCPNCGYQVVDESKGRLIGLLRRLWPGRGGGGAPRRRGAMPDFTPVDPGAGAAKRAVPLTHFPLRTRARVRRLAGMSPDRLTRLSVFGIVPGAEVEVRQRRPVPILRVGHTEMALSEAILNQIWIDLPPEAARAPQVGGAPPVGIGRAL